MTSYEKVKDMNVFSEIDNFFVDSIYISVEKTGLCWPADANFIVSKNGAIFWNKKKSLRNIKIWVECESHEEDEVFSGLFSTKEHPNPSQLCTYKNSRSASFLMSKILRFSDFTDGFMRSRVMSNPNYLKVQHEDGFEVYRAVPLED